MKNKYTFLQFGTLLFVFSYMVDRFFVKINDSLYTAILMLVVVLIIAGMLKERQ